MTKIKTFYPKKPGEFPLVIGLPGFIPNLEGGRIENILSELTNLGIAGYGVTYLGITNEGGKVTCNFSRDGFRRDLVDSIEEAKKDSRINDSQISFLVSSVSGWILGDYLANNPEAIEPSSIVSISPQLGWPYYLKEETRRELERLPYLELSPPGGGKMVIIPEGAFKELRQTNALEDLETKYHGPRINMLTIIGKNDSISDIGSMIRYHQKLSRKKGSYLMKIDCDHAVPHEEVKSRIMGFFEENASRKAA